MFDVQYQYAYTVSLYDMIQVIILFTDLIVAHKPRSVVSFIKRIRRLKATDLIPHVCIVHGQVTNKHHHGRFWFQSTDG